MLFAIFVTFSLFFLSFDKKELIPSVSYDWSKPKWFCLLLALFEGHLSLVSHFTCYARKAKEAMSLYEMKGLSPFCGAKSLLF